MTTITAKNVVTGKETKWVIPSLFEAIEHSHRTDGVQFDRVERKNIRGGLPMVWVKA